MKRILAFLCLFGTLTIVDYNTGRVNVIQTYETPKSVTLFPNNNDSAWVEVDRNGNGLYMPGNNKNPVFFDMDYRPSQLNMDSDGE